MGLLEGLSEIRDLATKIFQEYHSWGLSFFKQTTDQVETLSKGETPNKQHWKFEETTIEKQNNGKSKEIGEGSRSQNSLETDMQI